jgi:hypothetical protein
MIGGGKGRVRLHTMLLRLSRSLWLGSRQKNIHAMQNVVRVHASFSEVRVAGDISPCCNHVTEPLLLQYLQLGAPRWLDPAAVIRRARTRKRADAPTVRDDDCVTLE